MSNSMTCLIQCEYKLVESMTERRHLFTVKLKGQPVENSLLCGHFTLYSGRILNCVSVLPNSPINSIKCYEDETCIT